MTERTEEEAQAQSRGQAAGVSSAVSKGEAETVTGPRQSRPQTPAPNHNCTAVSQVLTNFSSHFLHKEASMVNLHDSANLQARPVSKKILLP